MDDALDGERRRVDAMWRDQLIIRLEVGGRKTKLTAAPLALDDRSHERVRMAQQRARLVNACLGYQTPDARAADDKLLVAHGIDLLGSKTVTLAKRAQQTEIVAPDVPEEEVRTHPDFRHMQPVDEHRAHEHLRLPLRELTREPHHRDGVDARAVERL